MSHPGAWATLQYFDLYGKSEREFDAARPGIHAANLRHSRSIARCLFGFMLLCSVLSLVGVLDRSYVVTYATILVPTAIVLAVQRFAPDFARRHPVLTSQSVNVLLMSFGVLASVADHTMVATAMPALLVVVAVTSVDRFYRTTLIMALFAGTLAFLSVRFKPANLAGGDITNMVLFWLVASAVHYANARHAIDYELTRLNYEKVQRTLTVESTFDNLTGLLNRSRFFDTLNRVCRSSSSQGVIGIVDIDDFKDVNDTYGHQVGDRAIHEVARAIMSSLNVCVDDGATYCDRLVDNGENFAGRLGGDEFVFVVRHCMADTELRYVMERLRISVGNIEIKGNHPLTVSAGIVEFEHDRSTADRLYHYADEMLYMAKQQGKDQYCIRTLDGKIMRSPTR